MAATTHESRKHYKLGRCGKYFALSIYLGTFQYMNVFDNKSKALLIYNNYLQTTILKCIHIKYLQFDSSA